MKLLLDTHTFIWFAENDPALSNTAHQLIADVNNDLLLSLVSIWEIQIKSQLGKLNLTIVYRIPLKPTIKRMDCNYYQSNYRISFIFKTFIVTRLTDC